MNLPNKLTLLRVIMIPFFILCGIIGGTAGGWLALAIFVAASLTDMLDGKIARKYNLVTDFGKFMDPLADKLLVTAALSLFVYDGRASVWILFVVILREFTVTGLRLVAAGGGVVIAASMWGKVKTVIQIIVIIYTLIPLNIGQNFAFGTFTVTDILMLVLALVTVISGAEYLYNNRTLLKE